MAGEYGPLQIFPPGLLGFLQLKSAGKNPDVLGALLQAQLELRDWLFLARAESLFASVSVAPASAWAPIGGSFTVPQGEAWWVDWLSITAVMPLAALIQDLRVGYRSRNIIGVTTNYHVVSGPLVAFDGSSNTNPAQNAWCERPFFVPPGSDLGFYINSSGASVTCSFNARITRLPL